MYILYWYKLDVIPFYKYAFMPLLTLVLCVATYFIEALLFERFTKTGLVASVFAMASFFFLFFEYIITTALNPTGGIIFDTILTLLAELICAVSLGMFYYVI